MNVTKSPLIHIGFPKCASTSLQRSLFSACPKLTYLGVNMKKSDTSNAAYNSLFSIASLGHYDYLDREESIKNCIYNYLDGKNSVVISNEVFSASNYTPYQNQPWIDIRTVAERLRNLFPEAKILMVVRNQLNTWPSVFSEISKQPNVSIKWGDYLSTAFQSLEQGRGAALHRLNYYQAYKSYAELFSKKNIKVILMEEMISNPNFFIREIINLCDISNTVCSSDYSLSKENTRATRWDKYKRRIKQFLPSPINNSRIENKFIKNIDKILIKISGTPSYKLSAKEAVYLSNFYQDSNKNLSDATGLNLMAAGYPYPKGTQ